MTLDEILRLKKDLPVLSGRGFTLRAFRGNDAAERASLVHHINSSHIADRVSNVPYPYTDAHAAAWIDRVTAGTDPRIDFVIDVDGEVAGSIAFINIDGHKAQMSYWLGEAYHGKGIMTEAVKMTVDFGQSVCGFVRIWGYIYAGNHKSQAVLKRAGFTLEGIRRKEWLKNGEYHDSHEYAIVV